MASAETQSSGEVASSGTLVHVGVRLSEAERRAADELLAAQGLVAAYLASAAELEQRLPECEFLLVGRPARLDYTPAARLRLLQVAGAGIDPLLPAQGLRETAVIAHCRGAHADGVRDHVLALLLHFARDLSRAHAQQLRREWRSFPSAPLAGKSLLLLGCGAIGSRVARTARTLGMGVSAVCRTPRPLPDVDRAHGPEALPRALESADYFVLCAPLTTRTRGLVGAAALAALPAHAVLVNVSRGELLDETALLAALRAGRLRGAALDVFSEEPLPASSPLWDCPRLLVTPHNAGYEPSYLAPVLASFAENVARLRRGEPVLDAVSREHEY